MSYDACEVVSWEEVSAHCARLAERLRQVEFDAVLAVARGGLVPAALLAQELDIRNVMVASVASYVGDRRGDIAFLQFPPSERLRDQRLLVADDIWDTGRTLHAVRQLAAGAGARVTVAVLHYKPRRSVYPSEGPDYWCQETDAWVLYPWERDTSGVGQQRPAPGRYT
jgi:hypoxanthine phosphoribosyltransferase